MNYLFIYFLIYVNYFSYLISVFKNIRKSAKNGTFNENTIGFDGTLQRTDMESFGVFGADKETVILTEIEKFRIRQGIRDK